MGPYRELAVGQPACLGARLGMCMTTMVVTSVDSRLGGDRAADLRGQFFPGQVHQIAEVVLHLGRSDVLQPAHDRELVAIADVFALEHFTERGAQTLQRRLAQIVEHARDLIAAD